MRTDYPKLNGRNYQLLFFWGALLIMAALYSQWVTVLAQTDVPNLTVTPNFMGRDLTFGEPVELKLNRSLMARDGRLAIFLGDTDVTALFSATDNKLTYVPQAAFLPEGDHKLIVYSVADSGDWKSLADFQLNLRSKVDTSPGTNSSNGSIDPAAIIEGAGGTKVEFTPNVAINLKGQNQTLTFPREAVPERNPFGEVDGQANIQLKVSRGGWSLENKFDFVGVGFQRNALRFGELQNDAPKIDLSSYLVELSKGRFSVKLGHVSFGSNRHLISGFSSRGLTVTVPVGAQNELSFVAANGTSIVGYDNFVGLSRRKHNVIGMSLAREFFKEHPGRLRFEVTALRGSLLPLTNFNQREVNDAEKSLGAGFQLNGNLFGQRLRYSAGYNTSRFRNPRDPNVEQGTELTPIVPVTRNGRHAEISFDFIDGLRLWQDRKLKLTGTFRHEEIEPLFRSVAASTQADRRQNQFEVSAELGDLRITFGNLRDNDNLAEIVSILRSIMRRSNVIVAVPLNSFFTPSKPNKWLPRLSFTYDFVHQYGAAFPNGGEFTSASQIPDQENRTQSANAQWVFNDKLTVGYRYNRVFQDNKQPGRERADFQSAVNGLSVGYNPFTSLTFGIELSHERQTALEQQRTDRSIRLGTQTTWQTPFLKNSTVSLNVSTSIAGDTRRLNENRNAEFDVQWSYRFAIGQKKFKKAEAQFFIRYANRYGQTFDRLTVLRNFNKTQGFNAGITFNVF